MISMAKESRQREGFFATKLAGPSLPPGMVARPRLVELLERANGSRLTLVSAPAGWGKTTALAAWMADAHDGSVAWLSLDRQDGDRARFWMEARATIDHVVGLDPGAAPRVAGGTSLVPLVNSLAELEQPLTLVLDDFQTASTQEIRDDIEVLLDRMPDRFRLVISTRSDPPLGLQRLRLGGMLVEIRARDLAFTLDEARELVRSAGVTLAEETARRLWQRTEGWAAGLRLAALSLQGESDPAAFVDGFAGSDHAVSDYLLHEVIARQPPEVLDLLLRISILDRVSPGLADAVTGSSGSDQALETLAYRDGLATALDHPPGWYRLNTLLAETLRSELRRRMPAEAERLHRGAAEWYAQHGYPEAAERHALAASDATARGGAAKGRLREPMSDRELAVLRLLPTMLSNAEIAAELYVSVNTVKTHLKHIYGKLDAHDRRTAVRRGRELGLLASGLGDG
jgi:LuxR family transcriptional regulator, maltose regulon positive regulatory protein